LYFLTFSTYIEVCDLRFASASTYFAKSVSRMIQTRCR